MWRALGKWLLVNVAPILVKEAAEALNKGKKKEE